MNRALLNPFESRLIPDTIDDYFPDYKISCFLFNKHGNILAAGTRIGNTIIFDFDTRTVATNLGYEFISLSPTITVTSLSFPAPHTGPWTVISYSNGLVRCYDTLTTNVIMQLEVFGKPVTQVSCHPILKDILVVVPESGVPLLVRMGNGKYQLDSNTWNHTHAMKPIEIGSSKDDETDASIMTVSELSHKMVVIPLGDEEEVMVFDKRPKYVAEWNPEGNAIFRGGPHGKIKVFHFEAPNKEKWISDHNDMNVLRTTFVVVSGRATVKHIVMSPKADHILINSHDRSLRVFKLASLLRDYTTENGEDYAESGVLANQTLEPLYTFNDPINRVQWRCCCFSGDGEYILGGLAGTSHRIPIYRLSDGLLEKSLEGPKEGILDLSWHPFQGVILTLGSSYHGIYLWQRNYTENWSAFAPDFTELEENEEYDEPEDEFDLKDDKERRMEEREKEEETVVDVVGGDFEEMFSIPPVPKPDKRKPVRAVKRRRTDFANGY